MPLPDAWSLLNVLAAVPIVGALWQAVAHPVPRRVRIPLLCLSVGALLFVVGDLGSRAVDTPAGHGLALAALYTGVLLGAASFFVLAVGFAGNQGLPAPRLRRLAPALALWMAPLWLAAVTNPWHGLFLTPHLGARNEYHLLWYLLAAGNYLLGLGSIAVLARVRMAAAAPSVRRQAAILIAALAVPLATNLLYVATPWPWHFDPTVLGLGIGASIFVRVLAHHRLFFLSPLGLEELLGQDTDGVVVVDTSGALLHANPVVERWLGEPPLRPGQDVVARLAQRLVPRSATEVPFDAAQLRARLLEGGELGSFETREGDRQLRLAAHALHDRRDRPAGHLIRLRDETPLHALVAAAMEQAATLKAVVEATDEGVLVHYGDRIDLATPQLFEVWRLPPEARRVRSAREFFEQCLGLVEDPERLHAMTDREPHHARAEVRGEVPLRDGRILEGTGLPLMRDGRPVGRVWRVRDVTEARRAEEALRHAQKLESLGVMSAGIAHDFNNLLVPILGNAKLLQDELPTRSETSRMLADIEAAADQARGLTRQLLAYAGKGAAESGPVDPSRIVREAIGLCAVSVPPRVEIACELVEEAPAVTGDPGQLRQVLTNLILNAAEAIDERHGRIVVSTRVAELGPADGRGLHGAPEWRPGRYVAFEVADDGCGMDEDIQDRIFDPFFTTKFTGRGLGLAATLGIVRSHGGFVRVESRPGRGTRFTVLLAAGDAPAPARLEAPADEAAAPAAATVLVADDEPGVLRVAERALRRAGMRVLVASDGAQALRLYARCAAEIDVVLLDVTMPRMDGVEVYHKLREIDPRVRVVFSSGHPEVDLGSAFPPGVAVDFVQKPYVPSRLVALVREAAGLAPPPGDAQP